jgi:hypothetical protein
MYNPDNPKERFEPYTRASRSGLTGRNIEPHSRPLHVPPPPEWEDLKNRLGIKSKTQKDINDVGAQRTGHLRHKNGEQN